MELTDTEGGSSLVSTVTVVSGESSKDGDISTTVLVVPVATVPERTRSKRVFNSS